MKFMIVLTTLVALATAARLPFQKATSQNEMIQDNDEGSNNYENFEEQEERNTISNSFDNIVTTIHQHQNELFRPNELSNMKNEISIPNSFNVGSIADTLLTNIFITGLKNVNTQNITMSWGEDLINGDISWGKLTVNGSYHYLSSAARFNGEFEIVLVEPICSVNTTLTKNANTYPMMLPASSVTFKKVVINHTKLPAVFQNEQPQFDYFVKNIVSQNIATYVANYMFNEITMSIRQNARPYLMYKSNKITNDAVSSFNGQLSNGNQFELKNIVFDNTKNYLAKISFVQLNNTNNVNTARLQLRLLGLTGESDWVINAEGKAYNGKVTFKFDRVKINPTLYFNDKTVHTNVLIKNPKVEIKNTDSDSTSAWMNAEEQLTKELVGYFTQKLTETTDQSIRNVM